MNKLWHPGERLNQWLIEDRLIGAWSVVYVVRQLDHDGSLSRPRVLVAKTLRPEWSTDPHYVKRFDQEAYAWLSLGVYKHIVRLFFVDRFFDQVFAFAEYIPQSLLPNTLRRWIDSNLVELESGLHFGVQICRALAYARSRGVLIHQDLRPENIMITVDGVIKVTDWGLSYMQIAPIDGISSTGDVPYLLDDSTPNHDLVAHGVSSYVAPELLIAGTSPTSQADIFSLGVLLVEMMTGRPPKPNTSAAELRGLLEPFTPAVRSEIADVLGACLSSSPSERPDSPDTVETVLKKGFADLVGVSIEEDRGRQWEALSDYGQRAYGLFMLGRNDQAMRIQEQLMREIGNHEADTERRAKPGNTVVLMDYKEHGFKFVVPTNMVAEAENELKSDPTSAEALQKAILVNEIASNSERALKLSQLWLKREPNNAKALKKISELLAQQEKLKEALIYLDRALLLKPDDAKWWIKKGKYLSKIGDAQGALDAVKRAVEADADDEEAHQIYGHLLEQGGDISAALKEFLEAARLNPDSALALYNIGTSWNKLDRPDEAFKYLQQAVEKDPSLAVAWNTLGALSMQVFTFQEALVYFERAIEADSHYARPWFNKGKTLELLEKFEEAHAAYITALAIDPTYKLAREALDQLERGHLI